jgi:hypothetical protein
MSRGAWQNSSPTRNGTIFRTRFDKRPTDDFEFRRHRTSANVLEFDVVSRTAARNAFLPRIAASCQATRGQSAGPVCPIIDQSGGTLVGFTSFYGSLCREDATVGAILLWLLGIPIPIIILLLLLWH